MATRRYTTHEPCPVDDAPVTMDACQGCRFFRGASSSRHEPPDGVRFKFPHGWDVCCNWPRDGMHVAVGGEGREGPGIERAMGGGPIPDLFCIAFTKEDGS